MEAEVTKMVGAFEAGRMTRRELVTRLTAFAAAMAAGGGAARAAEAGSTFEGTGLNHIALNVTDVARSRDFYIEHLGLSVTRESASNCFLNCGDNFVALFRNSTAGLNHYCYSVKGYNVNDAEEKLRAKGFEPRVAGRRIYFPDADGIEVQLAAADLRA